MAKRKLSVRTQLDLGTFKDNEVNTEPSMTDPSSDEPIEKLVARCLRGGSVPFREGGYDVGAGVDPGAAFDNQSLTERKGFDLSDVPEIVERGKEAVKQLKKGKKVETPLPKVEKSQEKEAKQPGEAPIEKA